jgi:bifunctional NMN adenylyltransferase/nudix hydrolase
MTNRMYSNLFFIGRFQIPHLAHVNVVKQALGWADKVTILLGSASESRGPRNPFGVMERKIMFESCFTAEERKRIEIPYHGLEDMPYNEQGWYNQVICIMDEMHRYNYSTKPYAIIGRNKDHTSSYLMEFKKRDIEVIHPNDYEEYSSTDIRNIYFNPLTTNEIHNDKRIHKNVIRFLEEFRSEESFKNLCEEIAVVNKMRAAWANAPYPPMFVTTDATVVRHNKVLLIRRGAHPGKGLLAVPGGYLEQNETVAEGTLRELVEETSINVKNIEVYSKFTRHFDHPLRSPRGRIVTFNTLFDLSSLNYFPVVKAASDAALAEWYPIENLPEIRQNFFEDHYSMLYSMLANY